MCGKDTTVSDGTACKDSGITEQLVCGSCGILFDSAYPLGAKAV